MKKWQQILTVTGLWGLANVIAVCAIDWYERTSLEQSLGLRPGILAEFESRVVVKTANEESLTFRYRVYIPGDVRKNEKLPVVLYLHGAGERGFDNAKQLRSAPALLSNEVNRKQYRCVILVPQCPKDCRWSALRGLDRDGAVTLS